MASCLVCEKTGQGVRLRSLSPTVHKLIDEDCVEKENNSDKICGSCERKASRDASQPRDNLVNKLCASPILTPFSSPFNSTQSIPGPFLLRITLSCSFFRLM